MDAIRKRLGPKKEVPRKIEISHPIHDPNVRFGPGKIVYAEPRRPEKDELWKLDPFGGPPYPSYEERTDHPGRLKRTKKRDWNDALENKNFPIVPPADPTTTFRHNFTTLEDFEFRPEKDPPRRAPSYQEQLKRYPPTHHSDGSVIFPPPAPSGYVPYDIQKSFDRQAKADRRSARKEAIRRADQAVIEEYHEQEERKRTREGWKRAVEAMERKEAMQAEEMARRKAEEEERLYGPPPPPTPPPKDPPKPSKPRHQNAEAGPSKPAGAPRLADVLQKPDYDNLAANLTPEQKKDLLPPPIQHTGRHARLRDNLAKAKAAKTANERQPLENSFVSNSVSTPAPDPSFWVGNEEAIYRPGKPTLASKLKFRLSSSRRADENSASTPAANPSSVPLPRQPRPEATHGRTPSRNAVYYTPEDLQRAAIMGCSWTRPRTASMSSRMEQSQLRTESMSSGMEPAPQPQPEHDPAPVASSSHVRSDSSSSIKRNGHIGWPPTPPLRIHKRNASTSSDSHSQSHTVLDYAMATTSRADSRNEGPPPVMRHRDIIDASRPPVIQRPGRLDSLPINTRSKNAKEEYFTPPPARVSIDPIDGTRTPLASEFGALPRRNHSTSSATAPSRLMRGSSSHSHSQSLQTNPDLGLPAHPAIHLGDSRQIRRTQLG